MFDVESTELHGEGFAVGGVVAHKGTQIVIDNFQLLSTEGEAKACDWVKENVIPFLADMPVCDTQKELRDAFYSFYMKHKDKADVWSDVNFPVETNFLSAIVADDPETRKWDMPYPLYDLATILDVNVDRLDESGQQGLRKHNPYHDALASLFCLFKHKPAVPQ